MATRVATLPIQDVDSSAEDPPAAPVYPIRSYVLIVPLLFLATTSCTRDREATINQLFEPYIGDNVPGAALLVLRDGAVVQERTFGLASLEHSIPVTPQTSFRLASITKQFTALAVMMLVERGDVALDDTLQSIYPWLPDYTQSVTIRHLLQHTSGLIAYEDLIPDSATVQVSDRDVLKMMGTVDSTYFAPGTAYRYSNTGYAVLATIIEEVSGRSYPRFLHDNIFGPLGMTGTVAFVNGLNSVPHRAYGYSVDEGGRVSFRDQSITSAVLGDGGVYSSIRDLAKWDQALYAHGLVSQRVIQQMLTPNLESYGFGWRIDDVRGHRRTHHTGSTSGFRNVIQRFPDDRLTVIILSNRAGPDVASIASRIADMFLE